MPTVTADIPEQLIDSSRAPDGGTQGGGGGESRLLKLFKAFDRSGRMSTMEFRNELKKIVRVTPALERLIETEGAAGTMTYASLVRALDSCNPDRKRMDLQPYKLEEVRPQPVLPPHRDPVSWEIEIDDSVKDEEIRRAVASLLDERISTHEFVTRLLKCGVGVDEDIDTLLLRHERDPSHSNYDEFISAILQKKAATIGRGSEARRQMQTPFALDAEPDSSTEKSHHQEYPRDIIANLGDRGGEFTRQLNPKRRGSYKNSGDILSWEPSSTKNTTSTDEGNHTSGRRRSIKTLPTSSVLRYCVEPTAKDEDPAEVFSGSRRRVYPTSRSPPPFGIERDLSE